MWQRRDVTPEMPEDGYERGLRQDAEWRDGHRRRLRYYRRKRLLRSLRKFLTWAIAIALVSYSSWIGGQIWQHYKQNGNLDPQSAVKVAIARSKDIPGELQKSGEAIATWFKSHARSGPTLAPVPGPVPISTPPTVPAAGPVATPLPQRIVRSTPAPPTSTPTQEDGTSWRRSIPILERAVHDNINTYRAQHRLPQLAYSSELSKIARNHPESMARVFQHSSGLFQNTPFSCGENILMKPRATSMTQINGVTVSWENDILKMSVDELVGLLVQQWIGSPGHRQNMLGSQYEYSGAGIYYSEAKEELFATHSLCFNK